MTLNQVLSRIVPVLVFIIVMAVAGGSLVSWLRRKGGQNIAKITLSTPQSFLLVASVHSNNDAKRLGDRIRKLSDDMKSEKVPLIINILEADI